MEGGRKRASGGSGAARCGREEKPSLFNSTQLSTDIFSQHANCLPSLEHYSNASLWSLGFPNIQPCWYCSVLNQTHFIWFCTAYFSYHISTICKCFFCTRKTAPTMIIVQQPLVNSLPCPLACVRTAWLLPAILRKGEKWSYLGKEGGNLSYLRKEGGRWSYLGREGGKVHNLVLPSELRS